MKIRVVKIRVVNMSKNAVQLALRAAPLTGGTWTYVGWGGESIVASEKIRKSMPHERVEIKAGDTPATVELRLACAVARLRGPIAKSLAKVAVGAAKRDNRKHIWHKQGTVAKAPK